MTEATSESWIRADTDFLSSQMRLCGHFVTRRKVGRMTDAAHLPGYNSLTLIADFQ